MAQKRMFSLSVVDTDSFLSMPLTSRLLYYELGMRADDDGFVDDWKKILLFTGLKEDDLKLLILKNFIIPFDSGVIVIRHWRMNNYLQNDRTKPTIYTTEKELLNIDENNVYNLYTNCIHSIDKNSIDKNNNIYTSNLLQFDDKKNENEEYKKEFDELWKIYPNKKGKGEALKKYIKARKEKITYEEIKNGLDNYIEYCKKSDWYAPKYGSTWFNECSWEDDYSIVEKETQQDKNKKILDEYFGRT